MKSHGTYLIAGFLLAVALGAAVNNPQIGRYAIGANAIIDTTNGKIIAVRDTVQRGNVEYAQWRNYPTSHRPTLYEGTCSPSPLAGLKPPVKPAAVETEADTELPSKFHIGMEIRLVPFEVQRYNQGFVTAIANDKRFITRLIQFASPPPPAKIRNGFITGTVEGKKDFYWAVRPDTVTWGDDPVEAEADQLIDEVKRLKGAEE